jgi:hypothetical protein
MAEVDDKARLAAKIRELSDARQDDYDLQVKLNEVARNGKAAIDEQIDSTDRLIKQLRSQAVELTAYLAAEQKAKDSGVELTQVKANYIKKLEEEIEELKDKDTLETAAIARKQEIIDAIQSETTNIRDLTEAYTDLADAQAEQNDALKAARALNKEMKETTSRILGIDSNWRQTGLAGKFVNAFGEGSNLTDVIGQMGGGLYDAIRPSNLMGAALAKIAAATTEMATGLMTSMGTLMEATTAGQEYTPILANAADQNLKLGLGSVEAAESLKTLLINMKSFNSLSPDMQDKLTTTVTTMRKFGIGAEAATDALDMMVATLGMTGIQAEQTSVDLVGLAHSINEAPSVIFNNIPKASNMIAQFGDRGIDEFKKLSASAKKLSVDLGSLLSIAEGFDTFETAADKVGSLNALLGGAYFDTVTMVAATEQERIRILMEGVQAQGRSWNSLDRFEKKAIASAAGISDLSEANRIFGMSLTAYDELQAKASNASMSLSDLSQEAFNNLSTQEKFESLLLRLTPVLDDVVLILDTVVSGMSEFFDFMKDLTGGGTTFKAVMIGIIAVLFKGLGIFKLLTVPMGLVASLYAAIAGSAGAATPAIVASSKALYAANIAAKTAAVGSNAMALAIAGIGIGIGAAAAGIGYLVQSFSSLAVVLGEMPTEKLEALGNLMLRLSVAGLGGIFGSLGLGGLALSLAAMAGSLSLMPMQELKSLGDLFNNISSMSLQAAMASAMAVAAINKMQIGNAEGIKEAANMMKGLAEINPETAFQVSGVMKSAAALASAKTDTEMLKFLEQLLEVLKKKPSGSGQPGTAGRAQGVPLIVTLEGKKVFEGIAPYAEDRFVQKDELFNPPGGR